jgi:RNA polymerase sigma-70 factor (ECF subfamily)
VTPEQERRSAELMARAQAGDREAYADALVLLTAVARGFVRGRVGNVPWVDDAVQDTLLSVHNARHTYDPGRPFAPWFYAIAAHRMIDVLRRERRRAAREIGTDELPVSPSRPEESPSLDPEALRAAVHALPARQREIVSGLKFEDRSVRELSARLGMTETAVKVTAHRGYKALRRMLGKPGG